MHTLLSHLTLALQVGLDVGTGRPRSFIYLFFSPSDRRRVWQFMLLNCRNCCRAQTFTDTVSCFWVAVGSEMFTTQHWQQSSQSARSYFGMCTHWRSTDASRGNLCTLTPQRTFCNRTFFESWLSLSILTTYIRFARGCNTNITMRRHFVWARTMIPLWRHICLQAQNRKIKVCFLYFIKYQIYYIFFNKIEII